MIKGNKGEWSEFYAFLKILSDGKLFAADSELQQIPDKYFTVLKVIREESESSKQTYELVDNPDHIIIFDETGKQIGIVERDAISSKTKKIFQKISNSAERTFSISIGSEVLAALHCSQLKAGNQNKSDLSLMILDRISETTPTLGFSIKSKIGSSPTLLNVSQATNFTYKITGNAIDPKLINEIDGTSKIKNRIKKIEECGGIIEYSHLDNDCFKDNLRMIDTTFPHMLSDAVKTYYEGGASSIIEVIDNMEEKGLIKEKFDLSKSAFTHKMKSFLMSVALGMKSDTPWDGLTEAHGGYIVVRDDGELVCYHLYNRDEFLDYLLKNTKFDTPSSSRHHFGSVMEEEGIQLIKLNAQIRFKQ